MKNIAFALFATAVLAAPAFAQDQAPAAGATPPAAAPAAGAPAGGGGAAGGQGGKAKQVISACRTEAQGQGLKGPDMKKAVMECVAKQMPALAARMRCRQDGVAKGHSGDDLKSFVKDCMKSKA